eukprot:m.421794 g.421794  ORF g.421794 m.421794 type:complete len:388 (-) comp16849_c0_seq23:112-1275(-)
MSAASDVAFASDGIPVVRARNTDAADAALRKPPVYHYPGSLPKPAFHLMIPEPTTALAARAFCYSPVRSVTFEAATKVIGERAFQCCDSLASVCLRPGLEEIRWAAFTKCSVLTEVIIPEGVVSIDPMAFSMCRGLERITLPESLRKISDHCFANCSSLRSVGLPSRLTHIGNSAFHDCTNLESICFPKTLTKISDWAFCGCRRLTSVSFPESLFLTTLGDSAFMDCASLTSITVPPSTDFVGSRVFQGCEWLVVATIAPSRMTRFGPERGTCTSGSIFTNCAHLSCVIAPPQVHDTEHCDNFSGCPLLTRLDVQSPQTLIRALKLAYWSRQTHRLSSPPRRAWVTALLLVVARLRRGCAALPTLPTEMWLAILEFVPRWGLGTVGI